MPPTRSPPLASRLASRGGPALTPAPGGTRVAHPHALVPRVVDAAGPAPRASSGAVAGTTP
jgi:hypothetical protein